MMKYTSYSGFQKHYETLSSPNSTPIYCISSSEEERKTIIDRMISFFSKGREIVRVNAGSLSKNIFPKLREPSLFHTEYIFAIDTLLCQEEEELLLNLTHNGDRHALFFFGLQPGKEPKNLDNMTKKGCAWLDLSREKPWEKEKRILSWLQGEVSSAKKTVSVELLEHLMRRVQGDFSRAKNELDKLLFFIGNRTEILLSDLSLVVSDATEKTVWNLADEMIWSDSIPSLSSIEEGDLLPLIGALRYHAQLGMQLSSFHGEFLPAHIKPYQVQKYGKLAQFKSPSYFQNILIELFQLEKELKSSTVAPTFLLMRTAFALKVDI